MDCLFSVIIFYFMVLLVDSIRKCISFDLENSNFYSLQIVDL
ncbi:hypothetical protein M128_1867 [Bacteroides fragilis str. S6L8]|nr:hypothetical protein M128_1867 [Bacteroides fragilis str. S6L8]